MDGNRMPQPKPAPGRDAGQDADLRRALLASGLFDPAWYLAQHPEVAGSGLSPLQHFLDHGLDGGADPGPGFSALFWHLAAPDADRNADPAPGALLRRRLRQGALPLQRGRVMLAAAALAATGRLQDALAQTRALLGAEAERPLLLLQASAAISAGDEGGWLRYLNAYLAPYDIAPVELAPGPLAAAPLPDRLATPPLPEISGGPKVSVIMAVHDAEATVEAAARSVLRQSWRNLELLILDDASTDGSWSRIQALAAGDPRIRTRRLPANVGPYVCRNLALAEASGEWITCHDADDWAHPQWLERHLGALLETGGGALAGTAFMLRLAPSGRFDNVIAATGPLSPDGFRRRSYAACLFHRPTFMRELGAWDCVRFSGDAEMILRAKHLLGPGYRDFDRFAALTLDLEGSLTNHPEHGTRGGLATSRRDYEAACRRWHTTTPRPALRLDFPPDPRPFPAPPALEVPAEAIGAVIAAGPSCPAPPAPAPGKTRPRPDPQPAPLPAPAVEWILRNRQFDPDWYRATFPDVAALGMDPETHFRRYGALMGRAPNAVLQDDPEQLAALTLPAPAPGRELLSAHEIALTGAHARALHYARRHLPPELGHTLHVLQANRALAEGDRAGWLEHLNGYLDHFGVAPVRLQGEAGDNVLAQLATAPLPAVTGGPLVSVIMPAFNAGTTVRAAARSILSQSWRNLELLIVDDASKDNTWAILQEIAATDSRVRIRRNKVNVGPYVSKNIALTEAKGDWITGHDADDWAHPERLERHMGAALSGDEPAKASLTRMVRIDPNGTIRAYRCGDFAFDGVACMASISCLYQKSFLSTALGFWDSVRIGADSEMISRAKSALGRQLEVHAEIGMICLDLDTSLTHHHTYGEMGPEKPDSVRARYRGAWKLNHETKVDPPSHYIPFPLRTRPFSAPDEICISDVCATINMDNTERRLKRIVFIVFDASTIGGISARTRRTIDNQSGRDVEYISISSQHARPLDSRYYYAYAEHGERVDQLLSSWSPNETVLVIANNSAKLLPKTARDKIMRFPIIYWAAGQMAFMLQDSTVITDSQYVDWLRASRIVCMSQMDIRFQQQMGIFGQIKGFSPVETRAINNYDLQKNNRLTYVGRIDFHAKDCERLIDLASALKSHNLPPLRVFTTDGKNSPDYSRFLDLAGKCGIRDHLDVALNVEDKATLFDHASLLILPSKKEAFGNVILEAYSFGVPVVGAAYAPGPAELIEHGVTGLLMDSFLDGNAVVAAISALSGPDRTIMSQAAFARHKMYSLDRYYDFIEDTAQEVLESFDGKNRLPVFPRLKLIEAMSKP